jgi:hypothetical protein
MLIKGCLELTESASGREFFLSCFKSSADSLKLRLEEFIPEALIEARQIRRSKPYWDKAGIIFVHIPRCGSVSIGRALYGRPLGHYGWEKIKQTCPSLGTSIPSLAVTRNPWSRLFSAYKFAINRVRLKSSILRIYCCVLTSP